MRNKLPIFILVGVLISFYLPLLQLIVSSLSAPEEIETLGTRWAWPQLGWYGEVWRDDRMRAALLRSLMIAFVSSLSSTVLALSIATALTKGSRKGRPCTRGSLGLLQMGTVVALAIPELVLALALLAWFSILGLELSWLGVVIGHTMLTLPFATLIIRARLESLDPLLPQAASDLGASGGQVFRHVILPQLKTALTFSLLTCFLLSLDDFLIGFYLGGAGEETLPVLLYAMLKTGTSPKVQALSTTMLVFSSLVLVAMRRFIPAGSKSPSKKCCDS